MNCILLPIHSKKINWLYSFIRSIDLKEKVNFDLILLVSNEREHIQISSALNSLLSEYNHIIKYFNIELYIKQSLKNEELLNRYTLNTDRCIVNLKKFCALHWAKDHYEYCAAIDCDTIFKDKNATHAFFSDAIKNYEKNIFFGGVGNHPVFNEILESCSKYFPDENKDKLKTITQQFTIYPWFFDVPFYQNKDLIAFFEVMNHQNDNLNNFWNNQNWHSFEHIIFVYFKLIYQNAKLINYSTEVKQNVPEGLNLKDLINIKYRYNYLTTWVRLSSVIADPALLQGQNIHMIYHVDRI